MGSPRPAINVQRDRLVLDRIAVKEALRGAHDFCPAGGRLADHRLGAAKVGLFISADPLQHDPGNPHAFRPGAIALRPARGRGPGRADQASQQRQRDVLGHGRFPSRHRDWRLIDPAIDAHCHPDAAKDLTDFAEFSLRQNDVYRRAFPTKPGRILARRRSAAQPHAALGYFHGHAAGEYPPHRRRQGGGQLADIIPLLSPHRLHGPALPPPKGHQQLADNVTRPIAQLGQLDLRRPPLIGRHTSIEPARPTSPSTTAWASPARLPSRSRASTTSGLNCSAQLRQQSRGGCGSG